MNWCLSLGGLSLVLILSTAALTAPAPADPMAPTAPAAEPRPRWDSPADEYCAMHAALRAGQLRALLEASAGSDAHDIYAFRWEQARARHRKFKTEPGDAHDLSLPATRETVWRDLRSDDGVDELVRQWQPEFVEIANARVDAFVAAFKQRLAQARADESLTDEEIERLQALLRAIEDWRARTDFGDPARFRRALMALAIEARATGIDTVEALLDLSFDDAVDHGDRLFRAARGALAAYDIDMDDVIASLDAREISREGERVTVRFDARLFGVPVAWESEFRPEDGHWVEGPTLEEIGLEIENND